MKVTTLWREKGGNIFNAVLIISLMPLIEAIVSLYDKIDNLSGIGYMLMSGNIDGSMFGADASDVVVPLLMVFAYVLYFGGLTGFAKLQKAADAHAILNIRKGTVWGLVSQVLNFIPVFGWFLAFVASVVAFFIMIGGYGSLKRSYTFPEEARRGAGRLRAAMIWSVVAAVLGIIPLIGFILEGIICFILFFVVLSGWSSIKNAIPLTVEGRTTVERWRISDAPGGWMITCSIILATAFYDVFNGLVGRYAGTVAPDVPIGKLYDAGYIIAFIIGGVMMLIAFIVIRSKQIEKKAVFTLMAVAAGMYMMGYLLNVILFYAGSEGDMRVWIYRVFSMWVAPLLFIIAFCQLRKNWQNRFVREGTTYLIVYYSLILTDLAYGSLRSYIPGVYFEGLGDIYTILPWIYLYLAIIGWRSVISGVFGKGEVVPEDDIAEVASQPQRPWIPESSGIDEQISAKLANKSDEELKEILANREDYNERFVQAVETIQQNRKEMNKQAMIHDKVVQKTDDELVEIIANSDCYSEEMVDAALKEQEDRYRYSRYTEED